jgi:hypothetical protein
VHNHGAVGLRSRFKKPIRIERREDPQVNDLDFGTVLLPDLQEGS